MDSLYAASGENAKNALFSGLIFLGLIGYIAVLIPLIRYRNNPKLKKPFYRISLSKAVCDVGGLLSQITGKIMSPVYATSFLWPRLMVFWSNMTWIPTLLHQLLIAVDRLVALSFPKKELTYFGGWRLLWSLLFVWLAGLSICVPLLTDAYGYVLIGASFIGPNSSIPEALIYNKVKGLGIQVGLCCLIVIIYAVTAVNVRRVQAKVQNGESAKKSKTYRADIRLMIVGALSSVPEVLAVVFYFVLLYVPNMSPGLSSFFSFMQLIVSILSYAASPLMNIIYSTEIRAKMKEIYLKTPEHSTKVIIHYSAASQPN